MKAKEIREMNVDEMNRKITDLKEELFNLRFQQGSGQLENPTLIGKKRRDIARLETIIREIS